MPFASGTGTQQDPYIITDVHMLQAMRDDLFAHYALGNDIDASETDTWNGGLGFEPVGPFSGSLDGRGHVITGLSIDRPSQYSVGLFSTISSTGTAYDVGVHANAVTGAGSVGVLAGTNGGSVSRCYTTGQLVHGEASRVGGLVGSNTGTISDCYSTVTDITSDADYVGGLVGENSNQVVRSYSIGKPEAAFFTHGGLVGWDDYGAGTVSDSYWDTETSGLSYSYGGEGKTTDEMRQSSTFVSWDFSTTWRIDEGNDYPRLQWEPITEPEPDEIPNGQYTVRLLDTNRKRIAIFDRIESWRYVRRPNEATEIAVTLPREDVDNALHDPDHERAQLAYFVEIYRGTRHVVTGRISKRDIKDDTVTIQCHTEEILLESHIAPAQYGRVYDNWDLADVARHVLHGWHTLRVKDKSQWESHINMNRLDFDTEPGVAMLAKAPNGRYEFTGGATYRFKKSDVPGFVSWDRIRWASDHGEKVQTYILYRYGDDPDNMGPWTDLIRGALPDEIGIVPGTVDAEFLDVNIALINVDGRGPTLIGQTPYFYALEVVARTEGAVTAGDIPASAGVTVSGLEIDGSNALKIIRDACEQVGWEFTVRDGKLSIAKEIGEDRSDRVLFRAGTNMNIETLSEGDDDLVNVLTALGPGEGINRLQTVRTHAESYQRFGPRRKNQEFPTAATLTDLQTQADAYLAEHALPIPSFRVRTLFPPDREPEYGYGDYVRVADPRSGIVTKSRIIEEKREWSASGMNVTLDIGLPPVHLRRQVRPPTSPLDTRPLVPSRLSVEPIVGGLRVIDATRPDPRWETTEIHASTESDFDPTEETLRANERSLSFDITGLEPGRLYYVRAIRVDSLGRPSEPSEEVSATAGRPKGHAVVAAADASPFWQQIADYVCDGEDDQEEINAAMAAGGRVELSDGAFVVSAPINVPERTSLIGQGEPTIIESDENVTGNVNMVVLQGAGYQTVERLVLDGKGTMYNGIVVANKTAVLISSVVIRDVRNYGINASQSTNIEVSNCFVTGCYRGISLGSRGKCRIVKNRCDDNTSYGIYFAAGSSGDGSDIISENYCDGNLEGIRVESSLYFVASGNICRNNTAAGMYIVAGLGPGGTVEGNICASNRRGIHIQTSENLTIVGNECSDNEINGILLVSSSQNVISSNILRANGIVDEIANLAGVSLESFSSYNNIQGNTFRQGNQPLKPDYGIYIGPVATGNVVTNNDLLDSGTVTPIQNEGTGTIQSAGNRQ